MRETQTGIKVTTFSLATEYFLKTKNAAETTWHKVVVWGKTAEQCFSELQKGMPVFIEGNLRSRKYVGKDKVERTAMEAHAESVHFLHKNVKLKVSPVDRESEIAVAQS
jgi:single-strand DNA-binding protein